MTKKILKGIACLSMAATLMLSGISVQAAPKAKKLVMNKKNITLEVGKKFTLAVKKVTPTKASKAVTYKTDKKKIATVTKKGVVKAKALGKAKITVTSKSNKKVKTTVKVNVVDAKITPEVTPTVAPTVPTASPVVTAPVATATPVTTATAVPTTKPTATVKPTAKPTPTPTPLPTAPPDLSDKPSAPYDLEFSDDTVVASGSAATASALEVDENGMAKSVKIEVTEKYSGIRFVLPSTVESSNFNAVTVEYKDSMNVGDGFGNGIWGNDKETEETVTKWSGLFVPTVDEETEEEINFGTVTFNLPADADSWYIKNCLLFCNDETVMSAATPATVTITKVTFWNTEYDASEEPGTGGEEGDYTLPLVDENISIFATWDPTGASAVCKDGEVNVTVSSQFNGPVFKVPSSVNAEARGFDQVTVTYKNSVDANFAAGLWKGSTSYVEDAWNTGQLPSTETTVTYKLGEGAKISYVDSWVLFSSVDMKDVDPFTVTITSVVFSRADK